MVGSIEGLENEAKRRDVNDEAALIQSSLSGDSSAFGVLAQRYQDRLYSAMIPVVGSADEAEDVVQEAMIQAYLKLDTFQHNSRFFTWLYRIAVNSTLSQLRRQRLRSFLSLDQLDTEAPVAKEVLDALTDKSGADRATFAQELQEKLNDALQRLSIKHRTVVTLFEIDGLNHQEIAEVMECSEGTVRSRLHYAKQQLQAELAPYLRR